MISKGGAEDCGDDNWRRRYEQPFSSCKREVTEKEGFKVRQRDNLRSSSTEACICTKC